LQNLPLLDVWSMFMPISFLIYCVVFPIRHHLHPQDWWELQASVWHQGPLPPSCCQGWGCQG
jgi:hypothetical protein